MIELIFQVIIYGIIEGITEWLPISSTGHLILFESFWPMDLSPEFMSVFRVVIQLGAILAIVVTYFKRLNPFSPSLNKHSRNKVWNNWIKIILGCIPAAISGLFLDDLLDKYLYIWQVVAITIILYGVLFIIIENITSKKPVKYNTFEDMPNSVALIIGVSQILAFIPGTSRSGVTIVMGLLLGCSRLAAADFTFCLAIPIMAGSSFLKIVKYGIHFTGKEIFVIILGMVVAFAVSYITVKFFVKFIKKNSFKPFGYYRIVLGILVVSFALLFPGYLPGSNFKRPSKYGLPEYVEEKYIDVNEYSRPAVPLLKVNDIVIHYTANPGTSAEKNRSYFYGLKEQSDSENATYASSNFIVGIDGEILAVVPIDEIAYCSNNRNSDTISIEVCHLDDSGKFTDESYESLVKLTAWLCDHFELTEEDVIRHYDITGKLCPLYYVENEDAWETFKSDVGMEIESLKEAVNTENQ